MRSPHSLLSKLTILFLLTNLAFSMNLIEAANSQNVEFGLNREKFNKYDKSEQSEEAEREERMKKMMRDNPESKGMGSYQLFDRNLPQDLAAQRLKEAKDLETANVVIDMRRERKRIGIFKLEKDMSSSRLMGIVAVVLGFVLLILVIFWLIKASRKFFDDDIFNSLTETVRDLLLVVIVFTIIGIVSMYNIFIRFQEHLNMETISVAGIAIICLWISLCVLKVFFSQWKVNKWDYFESLVGEKMELTKEFSELMNREAELSRDEKSKLNKLLKYMEYFNLRDDFIHPSFLPNLGECVYREDFPFSDYLCLSLAKLLRTHFGFDFWSYVFFFLVLMAVYLIAGIKSTPLLVKKILKLDCWHFFNLFCIDLYYFFC